MKEEVPMSKTSGAREVGRPKAIGLVPNTRRMPPGGATARLQLTVWMATRSARAIRST